MRPKQMRLPARLTKAPELQQQPCVTSCWPTSLAMAIDTPVLEVMDYIGNIGINFNAGMDKDKCHYILTRMGLGYQEFLNIGLGLYPGHYIVELPSLNAVGYTHCVYLYIDEDNEPVVFDPNNGKKDKNFYCLESFYQMPAISFCALNDFSEIVLMNFDI